MCDWQAGNILCRKSFRLRSCSWCHPAKNASHEFTKRIKTNEEARERERKAIARTHGG